MHPQELEKSLLAEIEAYALRYTGEAAQILLRHFPSTGSGQGRTPVAVEFKGQGKGSPVTAADREAEEYLQAAIQRDFPGHAILGEEGAEVPAADSPFLWVLDPLDGTKNFANGLPLFACSVGVLHQGRPVVGCIFVPPTSASGGSGLFHARAGGGAWMDGQPLRVLADPTPDQSRLISFPGGFWHWLRFVGPLRKEPGELRTLGSIAYELTLVASGTLQYAFFGGSHLWDVAAGVLLVQEAGGLVLWRSPQATWGRTWRPLESFELPRPRRGHAKSFRDWSGSLVAGNPHVVAFVTRNLRRRFRPLWLLRYLWRRWAQERQAEPQPQAK